MHLVCTLLSSSSHCYPNLPSLCPMKSFSLLHTFQCHYPHSFMSCTCLSHMEPHFSPPPPFHFWHCVWHVLHCILQCILVHNLICCISHHKLYRRCTRCMGICIWKFLVEQGIKCFTWLYDILFSIFLAGGEGVIKLFSTIQQKCRIQLVFRSIYIDSGKQ